MARSLPVVDTRQALLEHLLCKVTPLCSSRLTAKEITLEISNNLDNTNILHLLQNEKSLTETIRKSKAYSNNKVELGEQLFDKVSTVESDLCAKITGMLLELDVQCIRQILTDRELLVDAVTKAKREYLEFIENDIKTKESYGEIIFRRALTYHDAGVSQHVTGMLLEMDLECLNSLLKNEKKLDDMIKMAYNAFAQFNSQ